MIARAIAPRGLRLAITVLFVAAICGCTDYDPYTPDTAANRAGFKRHLGQDPTPDVKGIYYYADEVGADAKYQLRFEADPETVHALADSLGLSGHEGAPNQSIARDDLDWWPSDQIEKLDPKWKTNASEDRYWMLWYDDTTREAFFLEFTV